MSVIQWLLVRTLLSRTQEHWQSTLLMSPHRKHCTSDWCIFWFHSVPISISSFYFQFLFPVCVSTFHFHAVSSCRFIFIFCFRYAHLDLTDTPNYHVLTVECCKDTLIMQTSNKFWSKLPSNSLWGGEYTLHVMTKSLNLSSSTIVYLYIQNDFLLTVAEYCANETLRLVDGPVESAGRVEICINGVWGRVCGGDWGGNDARVVCRQLGYDANTS